MYEKRALGKSAMQIKDNKWSTLVLRKKRVFFTMFIIAIYVLGRHILLPGYNSSIEGLGMKEGNPLASLYFLAGIDVSQISVFSLGLGPWITTMIVWQVMNLNKSYTILVSQKDGFLSENANLVLCDCAGTCHYVHRL
mgnify:CR=1 FL=1